MNTTLDSFESALLAELRQHVAEHPGPVRRPRRRLRVVAAAAVTGIAASVVAVSGLGGPGGLTGSPAYAVEKDAHGDVTVTVHRLDDAAGLERALRDQGIDADVSYDADGFAGTFGSGPAGQPPAPPPSGAGGEQGHTEVHGDAGPEASQAGPGAASTGEDDPCGLGDDPATLSQEGEDWVLRIPAGSPLQDRHVDLGTGADGALMVQYAGDQPHSMCGMVSVHRSPSAVG